MHILFVVPYVPNRIRARPYNYLRQLSGRDNQITLLTLYSGDEEAADLQALRELGITVFSERLLPLRSVVNCLSVLPAAEPLQAAYCWQPALARRLGELLTQVTADRPVDIVHVEHLRGARYALHAQSIVNELEASGNRSGKRRPQVRIIWDSVDSISHLFRQAGEHHHDIVGRWITRFELPRTEQFEGWLVWQFDTILTTSTVDRGALLRQANAYRTGTPAIRVLPNGVDLDYFHPQPSIEREMDTLILTGKMSYHANVAMALFFVREVMPLVWAKRPTTKVLIVGKDPTADVRALSNDLRVTVTGTVSDLRAYLLRATLAVAPITYGAGIQNKVLEAMATGTPVVASPIAVSALSAVPGRDLLVGETPAELAGAILLLLDDSVARSSMAIAGRAYVETHHRWADVVDHLEEIYHSAQSL